MRVNEKTKKISGNGIDCLEINNSDLRLGHSIWHHSLEIYV